MTFARVGTRPLAVVGVISDSTAQALGTDVLVSLATYDRLYAERVDASLLVKVSDGSSVGSAQRDLESALSALPPVEVRDQAAAADARTRVVDQIVGMVTVLLLLSVLIAMLGITNTLALSILERTREIGLLRAVGMTRGQLRWAIRAEAVLTSAVGLVVGLALGVGFAAVALTAAGHDRGGAVSLPIGVLAMVTGIAAVVGLVAGVVPARRAARMEVLAAIADT
jgi:putative ABC transport system permease protein